MSEGGRSVAKKKFFTYNRALRIADMNHLAGTRSAGGGVVFCNVSFAGLRILAYIPAYVGRLQLSFVQLAFQSA